MPKLEDLSGKRFGSLTVLERSEKRGARGERTVPLWSCRCDCGSITYKATDTLKGNARCCCHTCARKNNAAKARKSAGFVGGTQLSKIKDMAPSSANTSGVRGVYYDSRSHKWRARLKFQGKIMSFGTFANFEDAVSARKAAEIEYFGTFLEEKGLQSAEAGD